MRQVVFHEVRLRLERVVGHAEPLGQGALGPQDLPQVARSLRRDLPPGTILQGVSDPLAEVRERIPGQRDVVDVARCDVRTIETEAHRLVRERGVVLDAGEPLFLDRRHELAVDHERGRRVAVVRVDAEDRGHGLRGHVGRGRTMR